MDEITALILVAAGSLAVVGYGIRAYSAVKLRETDYKIAQSKKMSAVRAGKTASSAAASSQEVPAWIYKLLDEFGVGEEVLDDDAMPAALERLLPMAKAFVESGGLAKLAGGQAAAQQPGGPIFPPDRPY